MNKRRILDAKHVRDIFLWVIKANGKVRVYQTDTGQTVVSLRAGDFPAVDIPISDLAINMLAEKLQAHIAISVSSNAEALRQVLASIALIAHNAGPKVSGLPVDAMEITPLVQKICTEFAVACAISFARFHNYFIEASKVPYRETFIALLMKDQDELARIFGESLGVASTTEGLGSRTRPADSEYGSEQDATALIQDLEEHFANTIPIPGPASNDADRKLSATTYWYLLSIAEFEAWSADRVLMLIDELLNPFGAEQDVAALIEYLEEHFANTIPIPGPASNDAGRKLAATSYWNLQSIAEVKAWSPEEVLMLIDEHLSPKLSPNFVYHSDTVSGLDWLRLYDWVFRSDGTVLWNFRAESSRK